MLVPPHNVSHNADRNEGVTKCDCIYKTSTIHMLVSPHNVSHSNATLRMPILQLRYSSFDGTIPKTWLNEVTNYMKFYLVPKEQWVMF